MKARGIEGPREANRKRQAGHPSSGAAEATQSKAALIKCHKALTNAARKGAPRMPAWQKEIFGKSQSAAPKKDSKPQGEGGKRQVGAEPGAGDSKRRDEDWRRGRGVGQGQAVRPQERAP